MTFMAKLKRTRKMSLMARMQVPGSLVVSDPTEEDETDHLIEEWIGEALTSRDE